jgi:hypothetical protein
MSLEEIVHRLERRVVDLGKRFVPGVAQAAWSDEADQLSAELNEHYALALRFREQADQLRARLAENEARSAVLSSQVETYVHTRHQAKAYPLALELDQVRRQLSEDRARLPCEGKAYQMHRLRITELERRLAEVRRKLGREATV